MTRPTFTAHDIVDLIALTPHLVGFHPAESLVLLTFAAQGRSFHARVDLPRTARDREEVIGLLLQALRRNPADRAALLAYSADHTAARRLLDALVRRLEERQVGVIDAVRVDGRRYYRVLDDDRVGTAFDADSNRLAAQCVFEGMVAHESRAALAATLVADASGGAEAEEIREAALAWSARLTDRLRSTPATQVLHGEICWLQGRIRRFVRTGRPLPTVQAGQLLGCCLLAPLRAAACAELSRAQAERQVGLWRDLVRRAPDELRGPAAALLALAAWLSGDGALAWCALDRCAETDPYSALAAQVAALLQEAVPPGRWDAEREAALAGAQPW